MMAQDSAGHKDTSGTQQRAIFQIVWGGALLLAGIGVFYRIPAVMQKVLTIEQFAAASWMVRLSFYLLGILLVGAGVKKIGDNIQKAKGQQN